jgi:hypothetical protein
MMLIAVLTLGCASVLPQSYRERASLSPPLVSPYLKGRAGG